MARDFTRTAAALAAYDAAGEGMDRADPKSDRECAEAVSAWDAALRSVGEAFADDTADINDRAEVLRGFRQHNGADLKHARLVASSVKP